MSRKEGREADWRKWGVEGIAYLAQRGREIDGVGRWKIEFQLSFFLANFGLKKAAVQVEKCHKAFRGLGSGH